MDDISFNISSDEDEVPFAERVARRAGGNSGEFFSGKRRDSISDLIESPSKKVKTSDDQITITPPPFNHSLSPLKPNGRIDIKSYRAPLLDVRSTNKFDDRPFISDNNRPLLSEAGGKLKVGVKGKQEKEEEKRRKAEEKQKKAADKLLFKEAKDAEKLVGKQTNKEEVHKYVKVIIDPAVVSSPPGADILGLLRNPPDGKAESVFQFSVESQPVEGVISWTRRIITAGEGGRVQESVIAEERCLLFVSASQLCSMVGGGRLGSYVSQCKASLCNRHLTLVILGYSQHFRDITNSKERSKKAKVRGAGGSGGSSDSTVSQYSVEEALVTLQVEGLADHLTFDHEKDKGWRGCAGAVFHLTRAVAEAPAKLAKSLSGSAGFSFWARADSKDCVAQKNLPEYWKQVMMQVSAGAGLEKAAAIAAKYPAPSLLLSAYDACSSAKEAEELLSNIEIRRTDNILGGTRKVGPDVSRRIYIMLTAKDPNMFIGKS